MSFEIDYQFIQTNGGFNPGYIYLIKNSDNHYKIGITKNLGARFAQLQTGNSEKLTLINHSSVQDNRFVEKFLHKKFKSLNTHGEWYSLSESDIQYITDLFRSLYFRQQSNQRQLSKADEHRDPKSI